MDFRSRGEADAHRSRRTAVLLDEQPLWLDALEGVLGRAEVETVVKTTSPTVALEAIVTWCPTLFFVDVDLDGPISGMACVQKAHVLLPESSTVALSDRRDRDRIDAALEAGASAYVLKTAEPADFVAVVGDAFDRSIFLPRASTALPERRQLPSSAALTEREIEVLRLVSDGHSNAELASMLWVTEQTVKFHLSNIYRKINVANRTEASRWAQVHGVLAADARGVSAGPRSV